MNRLDVALSFLHQDQPLAERISDALAGQLEVFVYSRQQDEIAGTDGAETFRQIFRSGSRLVVVLYREPWGVRGWTNVEARAIEDRFVKEGPDFLLFVDLDGRSQAPKWVPESHIRLNYEVYGFDALIGAIRIRSQQLGAVLKRQTAVDRGVLLARDLAFETNRGAFLRSTRGVKAASVELETLFRLLGESVTELNSRAPHLKLRFGHDDTRMVLTTGRVSLAISWHYKYSSSLDESGLIVKRFVGPLLLPCEEGTYSVAAVEVDRQDFQLALVPTGVVWRREKGKPQSSAHLAEKALDQTLDLLRRYEKGELNDLRSRSRGAPGDFRVW